MKVGLLYADKEWRGGAGYFDKAEIIKDLNLEILFRTAGYASEESQTERKVLTSERDDYLVDVMRRVMSEPLTTEEEIMYRQRLIKETLHNYSRMSELSTLARQADDVISRMSSDRKQTLFRTGSADQNRLLVTQLDYLSKLVEFLDKEKVLLIAWKDRADAEEMKAFIQRFLEEYDDGRQRLMHDVLRDLYGAAAGGNFLLSTSLSAGFSFGDMTVGDIAPALRKRKGFGTKVTEKVSQLYQNMLSKTHYVMNSEDIQLKQDIEEVKSAALAYVIKKFGGFAEDTAYYFQQLAIQSSFYVAAVNLYHRVQKFAVPLCFPKVGSRDTLVFSELMELSLAILNHQRPVANTYTEPGKRIFVITGANQGGKSTFLRSIAVAQVMMQCGLFVAARSFESGLYKNVFTHFSRREDSAMNSGRLDEELKRMERIVDNMTSDSILFLNESFATTTEKEGSMIAADIVHALDEHHIRVMMVTHLMAFARDYYKEKPEGVVFLAAERKQDGQRTFQMVVHEPEETSYGLDLYDELIKKD